MKKSRRTIVVARAINENSSDINQDDDVHSNMKMSQTSSKQQKCTVLPSSESFGSLNNEYFASSEKHTNVKTYLALGNAQDIVNYQHFVNQQQARKEILSDASCLSDKCERGLDKAAIHKFTSASKLGTFRNMDILGENDTYVDQWLSGQSHSESQDGIAIYKQRVKTHNNEAALKISLYYRSQNELDQTKKRDSVIAHRKWLKSLPIHERIAVQRQTNILLKWKAINKTWEAFKTQTAKRLEKPVEKLVINRAAGYRERIEAYDTLQNAKPLVDKVGNDFWLTTLRNESTRYVPVGNIFSGLFCPIKDTIRIGSRVRRPLDYVVSDDWTFGHNANNRSFLSNTQRRSQEQIDMQKRKLRNQLKVIMPHEVEASDKNGLTVITTDLHEWATNTHINLETGSTIAAKYSNDVISHEKIQSPRNTSVDNESNIYEVPTAHKSLVIRRYKDDMTHMEDNDNLYHGLSSLRLNFYVQNLGQQHQQIAIKNVGESAVHLHWTRQQVIRPNILGCLPHCSKSWCNIKQPCTSISMLTSTILPKEQLIFTFSFKPAAPGITEELWHLNTDPPPDLLVAENQIEVLCYCIAVNNFTPITKHCLQLSKLSSKTTYFEIVQLLGEILTKDLRLPDTAFETKHKNSIGCLIENPRNSFFGNIKVFYSQIFVTAGHALYNQAYKVINMLQKTSDNRGNPSGSEISYKLDKCSANDKYQNTATLKQVAIDFQFSFENNQSSSLGDISRFCTRWDECFDSLVEISMAADAANIILRKHLVATIANANKAEKSANLEMNEDEDDGESSDNSDENISDGEYDFLCTPNNKCSGSSLSKVKTEKQQKEKDNFKMEAERVKMEQTKQLLEMIPGKFEHAIKSLYYSSHITPYTSSQLQRKLFENFLLYLSEMPLIYDIILLDKENTHIDDFETAVRDLVIRAIDDSIEYDRKEENQDANNYNIVNGLNCYLRCSYTNIDTAYSQLANRWPYKYSTNCITLLVQVDMDIANWFCLTPVINEATNHVDSKKAKLYKELDSKPLYKWEEAFRNINSENQELESHHNKMLFKIYKVAESTRDLLEHCKLLHEKGGPFVKAIVLVSELSYPPITEASRNLLCSLIVKRQEQAMSAAFSGTEGNTKPSEPIKASVNVNVDPQIQKSKTVDDSSVMLKGLTPFLQKLLDRKVLYCATISELKAILGSQDVRIGQDKIEDTASMRTYSSTVNNPHENQTNNCLVNELDRDKNVFIKNTCAMPQIIVMENLYTLAQEFDTGPEAMEPPKDRVEHKELSNTDGGKANPLKQEPKATVPKTWAMPKNQPESAIKQHDSRSSFNSNYLLGRDTAEPSAMCGQPRVSSVSQLRKLGSNFAQLCDIFIADVFPKFGWEVAFQYFDKTLSQETANRSLETPTTSSDHQDDSLSGKPSSRLQEPDTIQSKPIYIENTYSAGTSDTELINKSAPFPTFRLVGPQLLKTMRIWNSFLSQRELSSQKSAQVTAIVGGKGLAGKLKLIDCLITKADQIYFVGEVALSIYRILHTKYISKVQNPDLHKKIDDEVSLYYINSCLEAAKYYPGDYGIFVKAVDLLQQKALRYHVDLLLPVDWIVGDSYINLPNMQQNINIHSLEEDKHIADSAGDYQKETHFGNSNPTGRDTVTGDSKYTNLNEPVEIDSWWKPVQFEGEMARVSIGDNLSKRLESNGKAWYSWSDVALKGIFSVCTVEDGGLEDILTSPDIEIDTEVDENEADMVESNGILAKQIDLKQLDWTLRAYDTGPQSMKELLANLTHMQLNKDLPPKLIWYGCFGCVEIEEFGSATKQFLAYLDEHFPVQDCETSSNQLLIGGSGTHQWVQRMEIFNKKVNKRLTSTDIKNGVILSSLLKSEVHPMLAQLTTFEALKSCHD